MDKRETQEMVLCNTNCADLGTYYMANHKRNMALNRFSNSNYSRALLNQTKYGLGLGGNFMKELLKKHYSLDIISFVKSSVGAGSDTYFVN